MAGLQGQITLTTHTEVLFNYILVQEMIYGAQNTEDFVFLYSGHVLIY